HKVKGLDLLVRAISLLKNPSITFVIAGSDDGYLNELKASISKFQISNRVVLLPACFGEEKSMLFKTSDVFVYPSYSEGFSLGILEAAAAYLPLVITTGCHFPDVSRSESGIVVPPLPEKIAEAISTLITNSKLREKYSKNAFTLINEKYSMSYIGNTLLSEYAKII
ncbi:MAG: glycosyltransferase family 4 protein, partial [Microgenomates group bacterium]